MKKQVLGWFAIVIISATAVSATKSNSIIKTNKGYAVADTTPNRMYHKKHGDTTYPNRMDTSMYPNRDSLRRDSTHK